MDIHHGISFIMTHMDVEEYEEYEIIEGYFFRKADTKEVYEIKKLMQESSWLPFPHVWPPYESTVWVEQKGPSASYHYEELPEEKWKYCVISWSPTNNKMSEIELASLLLPLDFDFGSLIMFDKKGEVIGFSGMPNHLIGKYTTGKHSSENAQIIKMEDVRRLSTYYHKINETKTEYEYIYAALRNYSSLRRVPSNMDLLVVGYFSIIESLITHSPRLTECQGAVKVHH